MLPVAISPCPNDTYLFWAWIQGIVGSSLPIKPHYADIDTLNQWAKEEKFPLIKVSINTYADIQKKYHLLPVGVALGYGMGPKVISSYPCHLSESRVAIPDQGTSAHFLFDLFFKAKEKIICPYHEVFSLLHKGIVDAGVIIHESRFTYQKEGFLEIADLGALWEKKFQLPIPLGGLALHKGYRINKKQAIDILQQSYLLARQEKRSMYDFILSLSQEKDLEVVKKHIDLYVTEESFLLSPLGRSSIKKLYYLKKSLHM